MSASSAKEHEDVISDDDDEQTIKEERMLAEKVELFVNSHERDTSKVSDTLCKQDRNVSVRFYRGMHLCRLKSTLIELGGR